MKQKNQKIGTFSRTNDRSGEVGEQKHGEEWKNSSENNNTFLVAVTSSKDVHAMHKTSKEQKSEKIHADFSGTSRVIVCTGNSFRKNLQKEQPIRPGFFEKECEEDTLPAQKIEKSAKSSPIFPNRPAERNRGQQQPTTTKKDTAMKTATITDSGSKPERKRSGILAGLSNLPIVNFLTSRSKKVTDSDGAEQESTLEELGTNTDSPNEPNITTSLLMNDAPHISPNFTKGMKLGELMFAIAAVYAHAKRHNLECRIPWSYNQITRALRRELHAIRIPSTNCGANEPIVYREPAAMQYVPIPEDITEGALRGYFHSPLYFADMESKVRKLFSPLASEEKEPGSFGIHINVGEGSFQHSKFRLATCYYLLRAAAYIPKEVHELTIFSETPAQAVAMLIDIPEYERFSFKAEHQPPLGMLRRMTEMQHLITSNDSISWWAAWLGKPTQVITHNFWFNVNGDKLPDIPDSTWIKL